MIEEGAMPRYFRSRSPCSALPWLSHSIWKSVFG
jgi:hypothetical protein